MSQPLVDLKNLQNGGYFNMARESCKYCKNHRLDGYWKSECTNEDCEFWGGECVEKDKLEPSECEYKERK